MLKALENVLKTALALIAAALLWRPGRYGRARARLAAARRVLLVRRDARVGEALLTTPLLRALADAGFETDLLVHPRCAALLEGCPGARRVIPFAGRGLWRGPLAPEIRRLRGEGHEVVVDCANWTAPSVTSALVSRLIAPRAAVIGPQKGVVRLLQDVSVGARGDTRSEVAQRLHLLSPLLTAVPEAPLGVRPPRDTNAPAELAQALSGHPFAVVNPGGRLGWRRIPPAPFAAAARRVQQAGLTAVITWGPGEESLAREVLVQAPRALLAPPTGLDQLAWLLGHARLAVCNNTGPMHLAVAQRTPTVGLFLRMEVARWGHLQPPHVMVDLTQAVEAGQPLEPLVIDAVSRVLGRAAPSAPEPAATNGSAR